MNKALGKIRDEFVRSIFVRFGSESEDHEVREFEAMMFMFEQLKPVIEAGIWYYHTHNNFDPDYIPSIRENNDAEKLFREALKKAGLIDPINGPNDDPIEGEG